MSWKRNGFSYVTWFLYLLAAGTGLFCLISAAGSAAGLPFWAETGIFGACFPVAGLLVFLIHRFAPKYHISQRRIRHTAAESLIVVLLVAAGLFLRILKIGGVAEGSLYFDLASLDSAKQIPQFAHGAVYFYLRLLHTVFFFFGNELLAAAWFQILAQTVAFLLLYLAGRHMAGSIAALIMLGFCELSSYMINSALTLSPDCLYLLFWAASLIWIVSIRGEKLDPVEFVPVGIFAGLMGYVDVMGFLLLFLAFGVMFSVRREEEETEGRKASFLVCLIGTILFFFVFLFVDSLLSKKSFVSVLAAWFRIYCPESFRMPVAAGSVLGYTELFVLFAFLLIGVFSFWRDGKKDSLKGWMVGVCIVILGECFGIFTEEVPAATYLYILLALLAGIGINECFRSVQPGMTALVVKPAPAEKKAGNGQRPAADTGKEEAAEKSSAAEKKAKKANNKRKKSVDEEKQAAAVKAEDVAAALFGGGAAVGGKSAAGGKPGTGGMNTGGGTEASGEKKAGSVKSEDVAAALFGGKASAPKPPVTESPIHEPPAAEQYVGEQYIGEPPAGEPPVAEQEAAMERHYEGNAVVPERQTAVNGQAQAYERQTTVNEQTQAYGKQTAVSEQTYGNSSAASGHAYGRSAEEQTSAEQEGNKETAGIPAAEQQAEPKEKPAPTRFIENPLPLPKKHEKREVDYKIKGGKTEDDYDYFVADDDDFDI